MQTTNEENFWTENKFTIKGILVGCLIIAMLIPTFFILGLVEERAKRKETVAIETTSKWAGGQTVTGPLLLIPYNEKPPFADAKPIRRLAYFLPDELKISGKIDPEKRSRTIYEIVVYRSEIDMEGSFKTLSPEQLDINPNDLLLNEARICIGISDFRGIEDQLSLNWNQSNIVFNSNVPENEILKEGLSAPVIITADTFKNVHSFKLKIRLKGSEKLSFTPVGKTTTLQVSSSWPNPSFDGSFLPTTKAVISDTGFTANWKIQHLNRSYPQSWKDKKYDIKGSTIETKLLQPVDSYAQTMRSVKYAILFIALTFALYFFIEITQKKMVHPIQYVLVGIALCIFYTLLLSISEYLAFGPAYLIASFATITLITLYTKSLFLQWRIAWLFCGVLSMLYGFIFVLIQLEDKALLFGSIGLFVVLSIIMYYSRKIDWYPKSSQSLKAIMNV